MTKKRRNKYAVSKPRRSLMMVGLVVLVVAAGVFLYRVQHQHAISSDKARFTQASKDVQTVAAQIIAAAGQPDDQKQGGKCSYAHQEFSKGPLTCEVYTYLAYGVNSPDEMNSIVQKAEGVPGLHGSLWQFKATTEKPYQFIDNNVSGNFLPLHKLFDTETKSNTYNDASLELTCAISFLYYNAVSQPSSYPSFNIAAAQVLLIDVDCSRGALAPYFSVVN